MKKKIEFEVDIPDFCDSELSELILYLSESEMNLLKGIVSGMILKSGRLSAEQLASIRSKHKIKGSP